MLNYNQVAPKHTRGPSQIDLFCQRKTGNSTGHISHRKPTISRWAPPGAIIGHIRALYIQTFRPGNRGEPVRLCNVSVWDLRPILGALGGLISKGSSSRSFPKGANKNRKHTLPWASHQLRPGAHFRRAHTNFSTEHGNNDGPSNSFSSAKHILSRFTRRANPQI